MKRLPLILILVLLLGALGAGLWWIARAPEHEPAGGPLASRAAEPANAEPAAGVLEDPLAAAPDGAQRAKASGETASGASAEASTILRGRVQIPASIDEPGTLEVFALRKPSDYRGLVQILERRDEPAAAKPKPEEAPKEKDKDAVALETEDEGLGNVWERGNTREKDPERMLARATVARDGSFELALPAGTRRAHIALQGRFLYLAETRQVDLSRKRELVITPEVGGCVRGHVRFPDGVIAPPAESLKLRLGPESAQGPGATRGRNAPSRRARLEQGSFEVRAVPCDPDWSLTCESEAFAYAELGVKQLQRAEVREIELALELGGTLLGLVRTPDGQPVAGAEVAASREGQWFGFDDREARKSKSDAAGAFELAHIASGKLRLRAKALGWLDSEIVDLELAPATVREGVVLLLREGATISGSLRWPDAKPAAGVQVEASFDLSQMMGMGAFNALEGGLGKSKSDEQGRFTIRGLGKGPFTLRAATLPPGIEIAEKQERENAKHRARADGITPGTKDLELVLRAPEGIAGRVLDDQGAPVKHFELRLQHEGKGPLGVLGQDSHEQSFTGEEGRFFVGALSSGPWKLYATAEGLAPSDGVAFELPRGPEAGELTIALVRAATIRGRVLDASANGVSDAHVEVETGEPTWQRQLGGGTPLPSTRSEPEATFELEGLKPGHFSLFATKTDHAKSLPVGVEVAAGQVLENVTLTLRTGGSISGEVYNDEGKPAAGMFVQATEQGRYDTQMSFADGQGRFKFEHLEPGGYQVVALPMKGEGKLGGEMSAAFFSKMKMTTVDVQDGQDAHVVLGAPPEDPVRVHGRVTHAGVPYKGALVSFVHEGKDVLKGMKNTTVDASGAFEVVLDKPGSYNVSVQKLGAGMAQQNVVEYAREIPKEKDVTLLLELPTGRISGRVFGPDGQPAAGARLSLHPQGTGVAGTMWGGQYVESATDGDGRYDVEALRPGTYVVMAGGMGFAGMFGGEENSPGREVRSDLHLSEGEWMKDVDFRLKNAAKVELTVVDEAGAPVKEASVFARDANGRLLDRFSMLQTNSEGKAHYRGLAPGEYSFSTRVDVRSSVEGARVKLAEGESKDVKLVLQGATILIVRVEDSDGKPAKVSLSVLDEQGREVGGMVSLSEVMKMFSGGGLDFSEQRVGPLPPGKYRVSGTTADDKKATKSVTLTGQPERKLTLRVQ